MKELPRPKPGYRWEPMLVPISPAPQGEAPAPAPVDSRQGADRRVHTRVATVMRTGSLQSPKGRELCVIKDVSPGGALIAARSSHEVGEPVSLRIKGGCETSGHIVRITRDFLAIQFERPTDLRRLLGNSKGFFTRSRAAMPQVEIRRSALLDDGSGAVPVTLVRIWQDGARVSGFEQMPAAAAVTLHVPGLAPVEARVTRFTGDRLDLSFKRKLAFADLAAWLAAQEGGSAEHSRRTSFLPSLWWRLRALLPFAAAFFLLVTVASKVAPAEADPVQQPVKENWQPELSHVQTMDEAMRVAHAFIVRQHGTREERTVNGIAAFVRARFVHGPAELSLSQNWMVRAFSLVMPTLATPVLPDEILQHNHALCSQQTIVFQELLRRYGIHYASVRMSWPDPVPSERGHFALAARVDGVWRYYDADGEVAKPGMPVRDLLSGRAVSVIYANKPDLARKVAYAARNGSIDIAYVDTFPAPRGALIQRVTELLSSYGWLLLTLAAVAARYSARATLRGVEPAVGLAEPPFASALAA